MYNIRITKENLEDTMENNTIHTLIEELSYFKERFINRKLYLYNKLGAVQKELSNIDKILEFKNFTEEELIYN